MTYSTAYHKGKGFTCSCYNDSSSQFEKAPPANRGLTLPGSQSTSISIKPVSFSYDWMQGLVTASFSSFVSMVFSFTSEAYEIYDNHPTRKGKQFEGQVIGTAGTRLYFNHQLDALGCPTGVTEFLYSITGTPCRRMGTAKSWRLMYELRSEYKARFTRLDLKGRHHKDSLPFDQILQAGIDGNVKGFRKAPTDVNSRTRDKNGILHHHPTIYYGSRQSNRFIRFYDPEPLHKVKNAVDMEVVFKDELANSAVDELMTLVEFNDDSPAQFNYRLAGVIAGLIYGAIDFIDRGIDSNSTRAPRLRWWADLVEHLDLIRVVAPVVQHTFHKTEVWLERQVVNSLVALQQARGKLSFGNWLRGLMADRQDRLPRYWTARVEEHKLLLSL